MDAQADLHLCCSYMAKKGFLMTWLIYSKCTVFVCLFHPDRQNDVFSLIVMELMFPLDRDLKWFYKIQNCTFCFKIWMTLDNICIHGQLFSYVFCTDTVISIACVHSNYDNQIPLFLEQEEWQKF